MDSLTPPPAESIAQSTALKDAKAALKEQLGGGREAMKQRLKDLVRGRLGATGGWYPLSHGQEALWFLWRLAPQGWAYNMALPVGVRGALDLDALRRALQALHDRHPCLRMAFREENGQTQQRGIVGHKVTLDPIDATGWSAERLREAVTADARRPFDLEESAAARVTLWRSGPEEHTLSLVVHHIVGDLWSLIVLMDELRAVYAAEKAGRPWSLPALSLSHEDFVRWEKRMVVGESADRQARYWRERMAGELPTLDLPTDRQRPPMQSFRGATVFRRLDSDLTAALEDLARSANASLYMALLAAYMVLLHRYSGQDDLVVGSPTAGRGQPGLADLFGDFINMAPLRADLSGNPSFSTLLEQVRDAVIGALNNGDLPFSLLVERLQPTRDLSRSPLFQTSFVLQKFHRFEELQRALLAFPDEPPVPFADLQLLPWPLAQQDGQFDLNLEMKKDDSGRLVGAWKYAADLFEPETVARMADSFAVLLRQIVANPATPVDELSLLTAEEATRTIEGGCGPLVAAPPEPSILTLFESQIARQGAATAVTCGDQSISYAALGLRVDSLAQRLAARGVARETLVAVMMPRGVDFVTALLAVTKAGGAFLPVDPRQPSPRTVRVLNTSAAPLVLTTAALKDELDRALAELPTAARPRVIDFESVAADAATAPLPSPSGGADLAYVMYTSGSTGLPKGVMVDHRGMVNHALGKLEDLDFGVGDTLAQNAPQSFDVVVWQSLAPLAVGGRVAVIPDDQAENPATLLTEVARSGVNALQIVPAMMRAVIEEAERHDCGPPDLGALRWIVPTGEALPTDLCRRWFDLYPAIPILNTYGSTECSDDQCHYRMERLLPTDAVLPVVTIGDPIRNMTCHVLDRALSPVPPGVVGELYIGGLGVGRGYRGDPARTAASFIPDPFSPTPGGRLYKTRDMARRRADGLIDFLGRVDHMIKLRGLRIEPGEIEVALCRHPAIAQASVQARPHPSGERRLVAYLVLSSPLSGPTPDDAELRRFLAAQLPQSMVPEHFRALDAMPLTANGKLDDKRLPAPDWQAAVEAPFVAPRTPTEETIAAIWAEVLGRERIGATEDFFAIGGDSIRSIQIAARCQRAGLAVKPQDLFQRRTVAALADQAARLDPPSAPSAAPSATADAVLQVAAEHLKRAVELVQFDD